MVNNIENGVNISTVKSKDELPNSIIVTQVPEEVFTNPEYKQNFCQLFTQIEEDIHFDFLKSFRRVRVIFSTPESATAAKLIVQGFSFHGYELKAFLAQREASSFVLYVFVVPTRARNHEITESFQKSRLLIFNFEVRTSAPTPHGSPSATGLLLVKQRPAFFEGSSLVSLGFLMDDSLQAAFWKQHPPQ
ncbi:hypothetical protein Y032_0324g2515 [Ancylostoma ceylanicum]|nr:hypothetical protein Y032_0324g2515 [Ancylostoma ceylanicum]